MKKGKETIIRKSWHFYNNYYESNWGAKLSRFFIKIFPLTSIEVVIQKNLKSPIGRFWEIVIRRGKPISLEGRGFTIHLFPFHFYCNFRQGVWTDMFFKSQNKREGLKL